MEEILAGLTAGERIVPSILPILSCWEILTYGAVSTAEATEEASGRRILPLERYIRVGQSICMAEAGMIV